MAMRPESQEEASLPTAEVQRAAREAAMRAVAQASLRPTTVVTYRSRGRVAVLGAGEDVAEALAQVTDPLVPVAVRTGGAAATFPAGVAVIEARRVQVRGYLGAFTLSAAPDGRDLMPLLGLQSVDLILDRQERPGASDPVPPPGYVHAPPGDPEALARALAELPELVGEFEKPRYFEYVADLCARGRSGQSGCARCLEVCPTGAITDLGERIEVDPYLCQGVGACTAVCPTGAAAYTYPGGADLRDRIRRMLKAYREAGGVAPTLLFHDERHTPAEEAMASHVLSVVLEELGAAGMDTWLAALAYGAGQVAVLVPADAPAAVRTAIAREVEVTRAILTGMGHAEERIGFVDAEEVGALTEPVLPALEPAAYAAVEEKRTTLRLAIDHLYTQAPDPDWETPLPAGAPFGEVRVDGRRCTLCMACTSVCPTSALLAGGDEPRLRFVEGNCVQCGICAAACPEGAVTLVPRFLYDTATRNTPRVLHEEAPFRCIECGKVFATASLIVRMRERLAGHRMFAGAAARRLEMCEDCRVRDIAREELGRETADPPVGRLEG